MARETLKAMMAGATFTGRPKLIDNNTVRYMRDGLEVVRLHHTDIILKHPDGSYELHTGGWQTSTTKERINRYSPARIFSKSGVWYLADGVPYYDGVKIGPNGELPPGQPNVAADAIKLRKQIRGFVATVDKLDCLPEPSAGDCWICSMFQREPVHTDTAWAGRTTTGPATDNEHLLAHVKEGYLHGSLIMNALAWVGYRDPSLIFHMANADLKRGEKPAMVKRALTRYLYRKLGLAT